MKGNAEVIAAFIGGLDGGVQILGIAHARKVNHVHLGAQSLKHGGKAFGDRHGDGVFFKTVPADPVLLACPISMAIFMSILL